MPPTDGVYLVERDSDLPAAEGLLSGIFLLMSYLPNEEKEAVVLTGMFGLDGANFCFVGDANFEV